MHILFGLGFKRKGVGCIILNKTDGKNRARYVGLIVRKVFSNGYKLCPLAKKGIMYNHPVPKSFNSLRTAEQWVRRHAYAWDPKRKYTRFNFIIYHILSDRLIRSPWIGLRLQTIITQILLAVILTFYLPEKSAVLKVMAAFFGIAAVVNLIVWIRKRF
jgi:hypothetical protein